MKLPVETRAKILHQLVEGSSMRSITRLYGVSINTVAKLIRDVGHACQNFHDIHVQGLKPTRIVMDEVFAFVGSREKNTPEHKQNIAGTVWTWVCMDPDSKLVIAWYSGNRDIYAADTFTSDVAWRIKSDRISLTTDGLTTYVESVNKAFNIQLDYATVTKLYGKERSRDNETKGKHLRYVGCEKEVVFGSPNLKYASTSLIERHNLNLRMCNRRFTRKTNAHSKKMEKHFYSLAITYTYLNFVRVHTTTRVTPAMHAGILKRPLTFKDLVLLTEKIYYKT
ncbi:MAG: hypothetical protein QM791_02165 [Ferruginibacter sp.]